MYTIVVDVESVRERAKLINAYVSGVFRTPREALEVPCACAKEQVSDRWIDNGEIDAQNSNHLNDAGTDGSISAAAALDLLCRRWRLRGVAFAELTVADPGVLGEAVALPSAGSLLSGGRFVLWRFVLGGERAQSVGTHSMPAANTLTVVVRCYAAGKPRYRWTAQYQHWPPTHHLIDNHTEYVSGTGWQ